MRTHPGAVCLALLHVPCYTGRSTRYTDATESRPPARHPGPVDLESRRAWSGARVRDRATAATGVARCRPGSPRLALSGLAPAGEPRLSRSGLEGYRDWA